MEQRDEFKEFKDETALCMGIFSRAKAFEGYDNFIKTENSKYNLKMCEVIVTELKEILERRPHEKSLQAFVQSKIFKIPDVQADEPSNYHEVHINEEIGELVYYNDESNTKEQYAYIDPSPEVSNSFATLVEESALRERHTPHQAVTQQYVTMVRRLQVIESVNERGPMQDEVIFGITFCGSTVPIWYIRYDKAPEKSVGGPMRYRYPVRQIKAFDVRKVKELLSLLHMFNQIKFLHRHWAKIMFERYLRRIELGEKGELGYAHSTKNVTSLRKLGSLLSLPILHYGLSGIEVSADESISSTSLRTQRRLFPPLPSRKATSRDVLGGVNAAPSNKTGTPANPPSSSNTNPQAIPKWKDQLRSMRHGISTPVRKMNAEKQRPPELMTADGGRTSLASVKA
ncbi:hypothetical protein G7Y89_g7515 [Cudoniella acicularis]|uniref:Uncharacterized protein n=1 Tax=Cudoniella acicularis TaxID=354080 RepID=A0A8H4RL21_9HELO|nr:hypothetical protein G7Y89_g7515 [Cudoniella acicularis]